MAPWVAPGLGSRLHQRVTRTPPTLHWGLPARSLWGQLGQQPSSALRTLDCICCGDPAGIWREGLLERLICIVGFSRIGGVWRAASAPAGEELGSHRTGLSGLAFTQAPPALKSTAATGHVKRTSL